MTDSRSVSAGKGRASGLRRTAGLLLGVAAATAVLVGVGVAPAAAHDGLVGSTPAADSSVATAPPEVELRFSGPPVALGTQVVVTGPDGAEVSRGAAQLRDTAVVQPLGEASTAGEHTVQWRSTSSDGHPISGAFSFTVTGSGAPSTAAPAPVAAAPQPDTGTAPAERPAGDGLATGWLAAGVLALGVLGFLLARRLRGRA